MDRCPSCGERLRGRFCERCGYDLLAPPPQGPPGDPLLAAPTYLALTTSVSREHWQRIVPTGAHAFPDPPPPENYFEVHEDHAVLGRTGSRLPGDVTLPLTGPAADPGVSRRHCIFDRRIDGSWIVRDCDSTNGIWVNDRTDPLAPGEWHSLIDGDRLFIGAWTCVTVRVLPSAP